MGTEHSPTQPKPLLLVDVDGVLNPLARSVDPPFERHSLLGFDVWLNPEHGRRLNELGRWFEVVWATTWEYNAAELVAPRIGLEGEHRVIEFREPALTEETWKLPDVMAFVGDRPFAWIDDDIGSDARAWADRRASPALLLRIDPFEGVREHHFEQLEQFGRELHADP